MDCLEGLGGIVVVVGEEKKQKKEKANVRKMWLKERVTFMQIICVYAYK